MAVGVLKIMLHIDNTFSIKDKRRVLKSILQRFRSKFNISISEIDENDNLRNALLGICCTSNDAKHVDSTINTVINALENEFSVEILNVESDIIHF